jgi:3-oxoacyl-[acyl-carrier-protein] synthase-3
MEAAGVNPGPEAVITLVASGHAHPSHELTSDAIADAVPGLEVGWAQKRLGMSSRRVAGPHEHISSFAIAALDHALARAGWEPDSLDAVVCGTSFVDDLLPATASLIAQDVAPAALAFDVNAACASGPYALMLTQALLQTRPGLRRIAVCVAERPTAWADYSDRESSVFWGDSAGCVLVERSRNAGFELLGTELSNDATYAERVRVRRGGHFHHDGRYSREMVIELTNRTCRRVLEQAGATVGDVRAFVGHQSNVPLLIDVGDKLDLPFDRQWHNVEWAGNQGGAGVITAFSAGWHAHEDELVDGDLVLLAAVGGGYSGGAALLRLHR